MKCLVSESTVKVLSERILGPQCKYFSNVPRRILYDSTLISHHLIDLADKDKTGVHSQAGSALKQTRKC